MEGSPKSSAECDLTRSSGTLARGFDGIRIHPLILDSSQGIGSLWNSSQGIGSIWPVDALEDVQISALILTTASAFSPRYAMLQDCKN